MEEVLAATKPTKHRGAFPAQQILKAQIGFRRDCLTAVEKHDKGAKAILEKKNHNTILIHNSLDGQATGLVNLDTRHAHERKMYIAQGGNAGQVWVANLDKLKTDDIKNNKDLAEAQKAIQPCMTKTETQLRTELAGPVHESDLVTENHK